MLARLFTGRWALQRRGDTKRLSQILCATKCDKLSEADNLARGIHG